MITKKTSIIRRSAIRLVFISLALRVVMPAGYMPAPLADGLPFVLCPGGIFAAATVIADHANSTGHHHAEGSSDASGKSTTAWESCPFGNAFASAVPTGNLDAVDVPFEQNLALLIPAPYAQSVTLQPFRARAPPSC